MDELLGLLAVHSTTGFSGAYDVEGSVNRIRTIRPLGRDKTRIRAKVFT
jgi:hypothetical protein